MFQIVILFTLSMGFGRAVDHQLYRTLAECEAARPAQTEGFHRVIIRQHGEPLSLTSRCVPASGVPI